jgi:uncharacterized protein YjbI with pentapeptide repeats
MSKSQWVRWVREGDAESFNKACAESDEAPSLEGVTFSDMRIAGFVFANVDLSNSEWTNCMLEKVQFVDANFEGAYFDHTVLTDCELTNGQFDGASFDAALFRRTHLTDVDLSGTELEGCEFTDCRLSDVVLEDIDWRQLSLNRVSLARIQGKSGSLVDVTLRDAELDEVDTTGLDCERCRSSVVGGKDLPAGFVPLSGRRQRV